MDEAALHVLASGVIVVNGFGGAVGAATGTEDDAVGTEDDAVGSATDDSCPRFLFFFFTQQQNEMYVNNNKT